MSYVFDVLSKVTESCSAISDVLAYLQISLSESLILLVTGIFHYKILKKSVGTSFAEAPHLKWTHTHITYLLKFLDDCQFIREKHLSIGVVNRRPRRRKILV